MKTPSNLRILPPVACLALITSVQAELLVYEPFDYPAGTDLLGADGGQGFTGPWRGHESDPGNVPSGSFTVVEGSLAHPSADLATEGNSAMATGEFGTLQPARDFANISVSDGDTLWISYIGQRMGDALVPPHEYGDNDYPRGVNVSFFDSELLANAGRAERVGIGNSSNAEQNEWSIIPEGSGSLRSGGGTPFNELAWAVLRIDFRGDETEPDDFHLWLNPDPAGGTPAPESANVVILGEDENAVDASDLDFVRPFIGNESDGRPAGVLHFDELKIGTTFADLSGVPEPPQTALKIESVDYDGSQFQVTVSGLDTAATYVLLGGSSLDDITDEVETIANPASTATFTDSTPEGPTGFYRVQDQ